MSHTMDTIEETSQQIKTTRKHSNGENTLVIKANMVLKTIKKGSRSKVPGNIIPIFDILNLPYMTEVSNWKVRKSKQKSDTFITNLEMKRYTCDLKQYIDKYVNVNNRDSIKHHTRYVLYICNLAILQLIYFASRGIFIYDIKPTNVFLDIKEKYMFSIIGDNEYTLISDGQLTWAPYRLQYKHELCTNKLYSHIYKVTLRSLIYRFVNMVLDEKIPSEYRKKFENLIPKEGSSIKVYVKGLIDKKSKFLSTRDIDPSPFTKLKQDMEKIEWVEKKVYKPYICRDEKGNIVQTENLMKLLEITGKTKIVDIVYINIVTGLGDRGYNLIERYNINNFGKLMSKCRDMINGRKFKLKETFI